MLLNYCWLFVSLFFKADFFFFFPSKPIHYTKNPKGITLRWLWKIQPWIYHRDSVRRHLVSLRHTSPFDSEHCPSISTFISGISGTALSLTRASASASSSTPLQQDFSLSLINKLIFFSWTAGFHSWHGWPDVKWQVEWMVVTPLLLMY